MFDSSISQIYLFCSQHVMKTFTLGRVAQWDSASTLNQRVPSSNPTGVLGWPLGPNLLTRCPVTGGSN